MTDELELRKQALVPNSNRARCTLCETCLYPNTIKHFCGTKNNECRVDQVKCVHCAHTVILINNEILNPILESSDENNFCKCYNHPQYKSTWVSDENLAKFQGETE